MDDLHLTSFSCTTVPPLTNSLLALVEAERGGKKELAFNHANIMWHGGDQCVHLFTLFQVGGTLPHQLLPHPSKPSR